MSDHLKSLPWWEVERLSRKLSVMARRHFSAHRQGRLYALERCKECGVAGKGWYIALNGEPVYQDRCFCTLKGERKDDVHRAMWAHVGDFLLRHPHLADMLFAFDMDAVEVEEADVCSEAQRVPEAAGAAQVREDHHAQVHQGR